jgi:hypothetical protein
MLDHAKDANAMFCVVLDEFGSPRCPDRYLFEKITGKLALAQP